MRRPADWLVPRRRHDPELMDAPGLPADEVADAYQTLRKVNRWFFGGLGPLRRELHRLISAHELELGARQSHLTLLEVGSGSGDLAIEAGKYLTSASLPCRAYALDRDPVALQLAADDGLEALRADALRLPFEDRSIDIVLAVKFAHHFSGPALATLFTEMSRVARQVVLVLDIRRSWLAYGGFILWSRTFTHNRLVRYDGPLSVLRGFLPAELLAEVEPLSEYSWRIRRHVGFQLALVGTPCLSVETAPALSVSAGGPST